MPFALRAWLMYQLRTIHANQILYTYTPLLLKSSGVVCAFQELVYRRLFAVRPTRHRTPIV